HDADAVPVLIDLLAELPAAQQAQCEEFLTELAGDWHVVVPKGNAPFVKRVRRDVWRAWWKATEGPTLLEEFRQRTPTGEEREKLLGLIKDLGKESARDRDRAVA